MGTRVHVEEEERCRKHDCKVTDEFLITAAKIETALRRRRRRKMRNEEGIDKDALSNLVLGPLSVVARDERHVQRDVLRDAIIVDDDDRGGGGGEEEKTKMETMVLRSERAVEKLERSLFEIDREIEAVEAATKDLGVEEAKKKEEKTPLRDVKLRKQ